MENLLNKVCLDSYKDYIPFLPDKFLDLVITDPPYWHKKSPATTTKNTQYETKSSFANSELFRADGFMMKDMSDFKEEDVNLFLDLLKPKMKIMNAYIFCNDTLVPYYSMWAERNGFNFSILVWEKPLSIINKNRFSQNTEYIVRIYDYGTALNSLKENQFYNKVKKYSITDKIHPTQKPLNLIREFIKLSSKENDIIGDFFMGSFTTAIACIEEKRNFIGCEINKKIFNLGEKRLKSKQSQLSIF
jgi:DNA modification methylase